jgi:hypothetical protein
LEIPAACDFHVVPQSRLLQPLIAVFSFRQEKLHRDSDGAARFTADPGKLIAYPTPPVLKSGSKIGLS